MARTLKELEEKLRGISHDGSALAEIAAFSDGLKNTTERIAVFNGKRALVREPILPIEAEALGFNQDDESFSLLQGDLVSTEAAYLMGERVTGKPKYVVLNSTCDLIPKRRQYAALLRVKEISETEPTAKEKLNLLLKFKKADCMYLPALKNDGPTVLCNAIHFDGICQIASADLLLANRIASLSLIGWRIFASFSRSVVARAGTREIEMRTAIEERPEQEELDLQL